MARRRPQLPDEDYGRAATSRAARDEVVIGTQRVEGGRGDLRGDQTGPRRRVGSKANPRAQYRDMVPGYVAKNRGEEFEDELVSGRTPRGEMAALTVQPTNTTNPKRPRTLAAGYDRATQTLSVIFRDGTAWNYYGVTYQMWSAFKASPSPGRYIRTRLDFKAYGPPTDAPSTVMPSAADLLSMDERMPTAKELLNRGVYERIERYDD